LASTGLLANYDITNDGATFTINKRNATWTTNDNSKIFGTVDPSPLTTGSGNFLAADHVTATYTRAPGETLAGSPYHITATLSPAEVLGNYNITNTGANFTIGAWTLRGFYQPVDMPNPGIVWNTIKGGSTVPLKFNLFAGSVEKTSTSDIFSFVYGEVLCGTTGLEDPVDTTMLTSGGTVLRYSGTPGLDGQFIQNWQTPKAPGKCYRVVMTAKDGSSLSAFFKTK